MNTPQPYTAEQTTQVLQLYALGVDLETIALTLQKSTRSIISKLVREGVYTAEPPAKPRLRKSQMIQEICAHLGLALDELASLEKATHPALQALHEKVTGWNNTRRDVRLEDPRVHTNKKPQNR